MARFISGRTSPADGSQGLVTMACSVTYVTLMKPSQDCDFRRLPDLSFLCPSQFVARCVFMTYSPFVGTVSTRSFRLVQAARGCDPACFTAATPCGSACLETECAFPTSEVAV